MTDQLQKTIDILTKDMVAANVAAIANELKESTEGKTGVGISIKLTLVGQKVFANGKISWARKFTDEAETSFELDDPDQILLPGQNHDEHPAGTPPSTASRLSRAARK